MKPECITTVRAMRARMEEVRGRGKTIALVPTMGYLHEGHLSLMRYARQRADVLVASIFVNPTQFGQGEDYDDYPRDLNRDLELAGEVPVDYVFAPEPEEMYPPGHQTHVEVEELSLPLCGRSRPGHFRGVATVVAKLLNIVQPNMAVFGLKDYQQCVLIRRMVEDLNMPVEVVGRPIVRESDGLAMSSRNTFLNRRDRAAALVLSQALELARRLVGSGQRDARAIVARLTDFIASSSPAAKIDYVEIVHPDTLASLERIDDQARLLLAVWVGGVRLIDNCRLEAAGPTG